MAIIIFVVKVVIMILLINICSTYRCYCTTEHATRNTNRDPIKTELQGKHTHLWSGIITERGVDTQAE